MNPTPHLLAIGFSTADAETAASFYTQTLGFERTQTLTIDAGAYADLVGLPGAQLKLVRLQLGLETLELTEVVTLGSGNRPGRPVPADSRSCDLWFQHICIVVSDLAAAHGQLQPAIQAGLVRAISTEPQTLPAWNMAAAGIQAYKCRDQEGHSLELLEFPADKGEARWHGGSGLFLGIDHSAISIANTAASSRFYGEVLGLNPGGGGINSGPSQDGLDGLSDTQVRITAYRCPSGAGLEALQYLWPNSGRPIPPDQATQDLAHWQIRLQVDDLEATASRIEASGLGRCCSSVMDLANQSTALGFDRALQVADPDGHQLQLVTSS